MTELPQAFLSQMAAQLKGEMAAFLRTYDEPYQRGLRVNPWKRPTRLPEDCGERVPWEENGHYLALTSTAGADVLHEAGAWYLQEPSAMAPAELLDVQVGDRFTVMDAENQEREMTVAGITEMYTGHFLFLDAEYYAEVFDRPYAANAYVLTLEDGSNENAETVANTFMACSGVKGIVQNTTMKKQIDTIVESLNQIMDVLILVSSMLAIVILYNLTNINVSERIRELSTIKVLGFYDKEVTMYIYRETIFLTILGVLTGFLTGDLFYRYMLRVVPPEEVMFNPALGAKAFIAPVLVVGVITVVLGKIINGKLKRVDMLEALKSVE